MDLPLLLLRVGAFSAGVVDAVIGGRGLIQIPMVFSAYPQALPAGNTLAGRSTAPANPEPADSCRHLHLSALTGECST